LSHRSSTKTRGTGVATRTEIPVTCRLPVDERGIVDTAGFDLSDVDEVDIRSAELPIGESRGTRPCDRADRADDVLAMCALLVFQDRPRPTRVRPRTLPGIALLELPAASVPGP
jgi:hypothetical protein